VVKVWEMLVNASISGFYQSIAVNDRIYQHQLVKARFVWLKMEAICSSETSVDTQRTTRRYIPEVDTLHNHRCENLKSYERQKVCNRPLPLPSSCFHFAVLSHGFIQLFTIYAFDIALLNILKPAPGIENILLLLFLIDRWAVYLIANCHLFNKKK
jgi:hypothetical protein